MIFFGSHVSWGVLLRRPAMKYRQHWALCTGTRGGAGIGDVGFCPSPARGGELMLAGVFCKHPGGRGAQPDGWRKVPNFQSFTHFRGPPEGSSPRAQLGVPKCLIFF